ncbi:hypothetical protein Tco_0804339 [Tanacetum coccineum]|uniref:Uncharacterized protein n=1 Tax=Tanacetum coccineum TaxID=301880 RepID=A0ABQ5A706_9ASTR
MGRDRAKKKGSSSGARSETLIACDPSLVDALLSKFTMAATPFFTQRKESSSKYLRFKERELELEERKHQEQGELERMRIAQREKELDLQQKMFEFQQQQKFKEDLKYYNEDHDHLTGRALSTAFKGLPKQARFRELLLCHEGNQEDRAMTKERYKVAKREAKIAVAQAKDKAYEDLYKKLDSKDGANDIYRTAKAR